MKRKKKNAVGGFKGEWKHAGPLDTWACTIYFSSPYPNFGGRTTFERTKIPTLGAQSLRYLAQNPFFLVESFSDKDLLHLDPREKCLLKKGFANEFLALELGSILGHLRDFLLSNGTNWTRRVILVSLLRYHSVQALRMGQSQSAHYQKTTFLFEKKPQAQKSRKIRLSETCLNSWCPGERRARLDGVEVGKRGHVWEGRVSTDGVERAEVMANGRFGAAESTISSDSAWFFT
ncbi:hypothetical protein CFP56_040653 [Quercus suber]|uniref:Uncharacterized protein n=1 Tax=Quercus suber TaxID=58331 RepID=A0AAW0IXI7_QUESU